MQVSALEGHRLWAPGYDTAANPLLALETRTLAGMIGNPSGLRVIDIACGTARWAVHLASRGARVYGIDLCPAMLAVAARKPSMHGRVVLGDAAALPLADASAGLVLCSFAIGYFADLERAIAQMARITSRGGRIIVTDVHPAGIAAGWTRSFRANGVVYEIDHCRRSTGCILHTARSAGLKLETEVHACFGAPEETLFKQTGRTGSFAALAMMPAVWLAQWKRP